MVVPGPVFEPPIARTRNPGPATRQIANPALLRWLFKLLRSRGGHKVRRGARFERANPRVLRQFEVERSSLRSHVPITLGPRRAKSTRCWLPRATPSACAQPGERGTDRVSRVRRTVRRMRLVRAERRARRARAPSSWSSASKLSVAGRHSARFTTCARAARRGSQRAQTLGIESGTRSAGGWRQLTCVKPRDR